MIVLFLCFKIKEQYFYLLSLVLRVLLLCFLLLSILVCPAQHPYFYSVNDDNGLPSNEVYDLVQDDFGFIWIGTDAGLFRYDGTDFIQFKNLHQSSKAISHLVLDKNKKLWCQNFSGQIFSVSADSLKLEYDWSKLKANFPVYAIDHLNRVWISADNGLYCMKDGKQHGFYAMQKKLLTDADFFISDLLEFRHQLFYASRNSVGYIENGQMILINKCNRPELLKHHSIDISFHEIDNELLLLVRGEKQNSLWRLQNDSLVWLKDFPLTMGRVFSMHNTGKRFWIGSSNGAICLNNNLQPEFNSQPLFRGESVSKVLLDKEHNFWFATLQNGIFVVPSTDVWIHTKDNSALPDSRVRKLAKDDHGNLFLGFHNGNISRYRLSNRSISTISFANSPAEIQALFADTVNQRLIVGQNKTWVVNMRTMQPVPLLGISNIKAIDRQQGNSYLVGTVIGSFTAEITTRTLATVMHRSKRVQAVYYDARNSQNWVCYADGAWIHHNQTATELKWKNKPINGTDICETSDETIWVSTINEGVLGFKNGLAFTQLTANLPNGFARKIKADGNTLWVAAEDKLLCYDVINKSFKTYNRFGGLPTMEISDIEFLGDKILVATPKGLVEVPRNFNSANNIPPSVFISGFAIHEKDTLLLPGYNLSFCDNNIRISFKGIAFRSHGQFSYRYRLLGLDTNWISTNSYSNFARYPSLPAGKYLFEVVALNEDGLPSIKPATLQLIIRKPFWQNW